MVSVPGQPPLVPDLLAERAAAHPQGVALIDDAGPPLTFGDWHGRANALARGLADRGIRAGDRVALWFAGTRWAEYAVAYMGTLRAGAVAVPLSPSLTGAEIETVTQALGCAGVIAGGELGPAGADCWQATGMELCQGRDRGPYRTARAGTDLAEILPSAGTSGQPAPVPASHAQLLAGWTPGASARHDPEQVFVHATPIATSPGQLTLLHSLREPHTCVVMAKFDAARYCRLLMRHRANHTLLAPAMVDCLVDSGALAGPDLSTVESVVLSSAPVSPELLAQVADAFPAAKVTHH